MAKFILSWKLWIVRLWSTFNATWLQYLHSLSNAITWQWNVGLSCTLGKLAAPLRRNLVLNRVWNLAIVKGRYLRGIHLYTLRWICCCLKVRVCFVSFSCYMICYLLVSRWPVRIIAMKTWNFLIGYVILNHLVVHIWGLVCCRFVLQLLIDHFISVFSL